MRIAFTLGAATKVSLALLACFGVLTNGVLQAAADEDPRVPEKVASYFSSALIPRLVDLYRPSAGGETGIDFDESTTIGSITRVMVWTKEFRAGADTDMVVELSNSWVAPIGNSESDAVGSAPLGLAVVWINPNTRAPELANFVPSAVLGPAIAQVPEGSMLVYDDEQDAWYSLSGNQLTQLAQGGTAIAGLPLSAGDAQRTLWSDLPTLAGPRSDNGFILVGLTLAAVFGLLAAFVLMPDRRRLQA